MNRVIRTARIAAQPVILPIHVDRDVVDLPFVSDEDTFTEEDFEAAQAQDVDESSEFTALGDQAEVIEEEPKLSMAEVEALIAERVQEVETRLLQEKEQEKETVQEAAQQAGLEAGQAQGYADGHAAGLAEGQVQSQDEIVRFQALISQVAEKWDPIFKSADLDVVELAFAIARKIVGSVVDAQEDLVLAAVRDCLAHVQDVTKLTICVNPDDLRIVRANRTLWQEAYERIESMTIEADDAVERGGCVIETPSGDIDGQISSRLEKLQTAILERLQGLPQEPVPDVSDVVAEPQGQEGREAEEETISDDDVQNVVSADDRDAEEVVQETELEEDILEADAQVVDETESEQDEDGAPVQVGEVEASEESETVTPVTEVVDDADGDRDELANGLEDEEILPEPDEVSDIETEDDSAHEDTSDLPQGELSDIDVSDESGGDEVASDTSDENSLDMTQSEVPDPDALDDVGSKEVTDDSNDENSLDMTVDDSDQNNIDDEQTDAIDMQTDENENMPTGATDEDDEAKQS